MMNPALPLADALAGRQLRLCALSSGSRGNCIYAGFGKTHILIDSGISMRATEAGLKRVSECTGAEIRLDYIDALLISHEHSDHIKSCMSLSRRYGIPVYASAPTLRAIIERAGDLSIPERNLRAIEPEADFYIGGINITPFSIPHDAAAPMGYRLDVGAASAAVATDIGHVSDKWLNTVLGCQLVMLEANHDEAMLLRGPYPAPLKRRILSSKGHLSNDACAQAAVRLANSGTRAILLSHISEHNNTPALAYSTVCKALISKGIAPGHDIYIGLLEQNHASDIFELDCE